MFESLTSERLVPAEFRAAYRRHDHKRTAEKTRRGCIFGTLFVPLFWILDLYMYPDLSGVFLISRLICAGIMGALFFVIGTELGQSQLRFLGVVILLLPTLTISYMITQAPEGAANSPYYAGLNLVLIVLAVVLDWTLWQSALCVTLVLLIYLGVTLPPLNLEDRDMVGMLANNLGFLISTGAAIIFGSRYHERVRIQEFVASERVKLQKSALETSNEALSRKTTEQEQTLLELHQTQDQLVTKEKQASLGVWSAGIIHEMNNPLNFARTGLYALRQKEKHLPDEQKADFKDLIADIDDGIQRVHTIVSDLRTYAHPGKEDDQEEVAVEEVVNVTLRFFSGDVQGNIEIIKSIPAGLTVHVNRNKLVQVLGNLLQNAVDALKTKPFANGEHPTITVSGETAGTRSRIIIRDNGPGIPKENLPKIFDPFFTTKDVGQGMGLGLGICYRIIEGFGGTISVRSEPGGFCQFTLDLPAERAEAGNN